MTRRELRVRNRTYGDGQEKRNERLTEFSARGKARHRTSETIEEGRKEAEKGTQGRSCQSGRNDDGVSEHQQGGAGVGEICYANLRDGRDRRKR